MSKLLTPIRRLAAETT